MHVDPLVMRVSRNDAQSPAYKPKPSVYQICADSLRAEAKVRTRGGSLPLYQERNIGLHLASSYRSQGWYAVIPRILLC